MTQEEHATDALHDGAEHRHRSGIGVAEGQAPEQGVAAADDAQIDRAFGWMGPHRHDDRHGHEDDFLDGRGHLRLFQSDVTPSGAKVPRSEGQGQHPPSANMRDVHRSLAHIFDALWVMNSPATSSTTKPPAKAAWSSSTSSSPTDADRMDARQGRLGHKHGDEEKPGRGQAKPCSKAARASG